MDEVARSDLACNWDDAICDKHFKWLKAEYAKTGCILCGSVTSTKDNKLTFHHMSPSSKRFNLGDVSVYKKIKYGIRALIEELEKCCVMCRECHNLIHNDKLTLEEYLAQ